MKHKFTHVLAAVSVLVVAQSAALADEPFRVKAGLSSGTYTSPGTQPGQPDLKATMTMLNLGVSYVDAGSGMFVDLSNRSSVGSNTWNTSTMSGGLVPDSPVKRSETSLTVGKMLQDGLHVFGGYQVNDSKLTVNYSGFALPNDNWDLKLKGVFAGVGKAMQVGGGWLSVTGSLSWMNGQFSTSLPPTYNTSWGYGMGYSLAASYSYPMTNILSVVPEVKYQAFKPNGWNHADTFTSLGVSVVAKF